MSTGVLLADDDEKIVALLRRGPLDEGYDVVIAATGDEAIVAARPHRPDVVLLDIAMPGPDGLEVCQRLRLDDDVPMPIYSGPGSPKAPSRRSRPVQLLPRTAPEVGASAGAHRVCGGSGPSLPTPDSRYDARVSGAPPRSTRGEPAPVDAETG